MEVEIRQRETPRCYDAHNAQGAKAVVDGSPQALGMRPMELLLTALASCACFDLEHILQGQRQKLDGLKVHVEGHRPDKGNPKPFESIHMHFELSGTLEEHKVARALRLATESYCSVRASLDPRIAITHSFNIEQPAPPAGRM